MALGVGQREPGLFWNPAPALEMLITDRPKEMRVGEARDPAHDRQEPQWVKFRHRTNQKESLEWSGVQKNSRGSGKRCDPRQEPEWRACLSLGNSPSDRVIGSL